MPASQLFVCNAWQLSLCMMGHCFVIGKQQCSAERGMQVRPPQALPVFWVLMWDTCVSGTCVLQELVDELRAQQPDLFKGLKMSKKKKSSKKPGAKKKKKQAAAAAVAADAGSNGSSGNGTGSAHDAAASHSGSSTVVAAASAAVSSRETVSV
jgi:hypothetical protein